MLRLPDLACEIVVVLRQPFVFLPLARPACKAAQSSLDEFAMRERVAYHVFANDVLTKTGVGFIDSAIVARTIALQAPGVLVTVARTTGNRPAVQVARYQVVDEVLGRNAREPLAAAPGYLNIR